jgi:hypothetical protein
VNWAEAIKDENAANALMVGILPLENHTKNTRRNNRNEKPPRDSPRA